MTRLSASSFDLHPRAASPPAYERNQSVGVVHVGVGAFHRAHQAVYFDALMAQGEPNWMIQGASLRAPTVADQMNPQDGLYTLVVRDGAAERFRIVGAIKGVTVAPSAPDHLIHAMAEPTVDLVTLTVTEKGYCIDPGTGTLRMDDPDVYADIRNIYHPKTAPGCLVAGL